MVNKLGRPETRRREKTSLYITTIVYRMSLGILTYHTFVFGRADQDHAGGYGGHRARMPG